jgi:hypothetical protein
MTPADGTGSRDTATAAGDLAKAPCVDDSNRLEWLICWYEGEARKTNIANKSLRIASILAAAAIPILAAASAEPVVSAILGGTIVALEAIQELFQFQRNYLSFATTKEALKRERALYGALAGPYRKSRTLEPARLLAERLEALVAAETSAWADDHDPGKKDR